MLLPERNTEHNTAGAIGRVCGAKKEGGDSKHQLVKRTGLRMGRIGASKLLKTLFHHINYRTYFETRLVR
jgi:hypothetical protein